MGKKLQELFKKDAEKTIAEAIGKHLNAIIETEVTSIKFPSGNENKMTLEITIEKKGDIPEPKKSYKGVILSILFLIIIFSVFFSLETDSDDTKRHTTQSFNKSNN